MVSETREKTVSVHEIWVPAEGTPADLRPQSPPGLGGLASTDGAPSVAVPSDERPPISPNSRDPHKSNAETFLENVPQRMKLSVIGAESQDASKSADFDGDYILDLIVRELHWARWEYSFPAKSGLYRAAIIASRLSSGKIELRALFEGTVQGPTWNADVADLQRPNTIFRNSGGALPFTEHVWPHAVSVSPIQSASSRAAHYISPDPTYSELFETGGSSSSGPCGDCFIERNAPAGSSVIIGQQVSLTIDCFGGDVSAITWAIPQPNLKDYKQSTPIAQTFSLDSTDLSRPTVLFYWVKPGTYTVSVTFTFTKAGVANKCKISIELAVVAPECKMPLPKKIGAWTATTNTGTIALAGADAPFEAQGIAFKASVLDPGLDPGQGTWQFVQLALAEFTTTKGLLDCVLYSNPPPGMYLV